MAGTVLFLSAVFEMRPGKWKYPSVSSLYWRHSWPTDYRQWITPDLPAPLSFTAFKRGEAPAMKVVEAYLEKGQ